MGYMLKEALKCLCGGRGINQNHWSYAVFWKIGCQNPKLLIWEEVYYEPMPHSMLQGNSEIENPASSLEVVEGYLLCSENFDPQPGFQVENRVHSLINIMMMNCQVNVVGEGIVGRAAFTGMHNWILSQNYIKDGHPPEVLNEVRYQYSAGMQTVAVVPVLPHGVVQFGSSSAIAENLEFVNDVKSLILHLGCVPGALLSENYTLSDSPPRTGIPISLGKSGSADLSGTGNFMSTNLDTSVSGSKQSITSQALRLVRVPSGHRESAVQQNSQSITSSFQIHKLPQTLDNPHYDRNQSEFFYAMKQDFCFRSQLENGATGAIVMPPNIAVWPNQQACSSSAGSGSSQQTSSSNAFLRSRARTEGGVSYGVSYNTNNNSLSNPFHAGSDSNSDMVSHLSLKSVPRSFSNPQRSSGIDTPRIDSSEFGLENAASSRKKVVSIANSADHTTTSCPFSRENDNFMLSKDSYHTQARRANRKKELENDLFQALNIPLSPIDHGVEMPTVEDTPINLNDFLKHDGGPQTTMPKNAACIGSFCKPSLGDDLFDILGPDFRSKLLSGNQYSSINGPDGSQHNVNMDTLSSKNLQDESSVLCSASEGISTSGIFHESGTDHLLDAIVSKANLNSKQSSDDDISCRTTLTTIRTSSDTFSPITWSKQMQGEIIGLPKPIGKSVIAGSSSYKSGCSKNDAGACSQSSYGSQINSWVEQGHSVNRDTSVSTAFSKRPNEVSKSNRKRLKPGENPRPRPKDRQMIQDRVKELREIVPNAAKCSIDALLERTIKHMLFLQSVTRHADKLKQTGESKLVSKDGRLCLKDNFGGGATWAYEVGSQSTVCPIIVEDLNPPRQMLVEMLCEEQGFFLEIADMIRGLELTILKGVMEARDDKIWARFSVEANRDVTRMEIFISLVRLLEQMVKGHAASSNGFDNKNTMAVLHAIHQTTCMPSTERPCNGILQ